MEKSIKIIEEIEHGQYLRWDDDEDAEWSE